MNPALAALGFFSNELSFVFRADRKFEIVIDQIVNLIFMEGSQDKNREFYVRFPQPNSLLQMSHAQIINSGFLCGFADLAKSMSVGIGFDRKAKQTFTDVFADNRNVFSKL